MRRKLLELILLALALATCATYAQARADAPTQTVLIDGSDSMRGFFNRETGQDKWMDWLVQAIAQDQPDVRTLYFVEKRLQPERPEAGSFGRETYINDAFEAAFNQSPRADLLWIITDNQSSVGGPQQSEQDTSRFYAHLRSDEEVARVEIFPLQLPFNGPLFLKDGRHDYNSERGLLLYAVLLNPEKVAGFEETVAGVESRLNPEGQNFNFHGVLVKPLDKDFLSYTVREGEKFRPGDGEVISDEFSVGEPISGHFFVDLTSTRGEIEIEKASVAVEGEDTFGSGDFSDSDVHPMVSPDFIDNLGPQNTKPLKISLKVEPVSWRWWNPVSVLKSLNGNRGYITGNLRLRVRVPPQNFKLVRTLTDRFSAGPEIFERADEQVQRRIYKLNDLALQGLMPAQDSVNIGPEAGGGEQQDIPVRIAVNYPPWPIFLLVTIVLLFALLLIAFVIWMRRQPLYRLTWQQNRYRACPDFRLWPFVGQQVELDSRAAATVRKTPLGIKVSAARGFSVDGSSNKRVYPSGTDFSLNRRSDGAGLNFKFSKVQAPRNSHGKSADPARDYGRRQDDSAALMNGQPDVRKPVTVMGAGASGGGTGPRNGGDDGTGLDSLPG